MLRILTDSTADLPAALAQRMQVEIIPLQVTFEDGETYQDGLELSPDEFYERLAQCHKLPSTSQPSPERFEEAFKEAQESGDELIAILLSSKISGTFQSAQIASSLVDYDKIYLIDGLSATLGNQLLVRLAVELRDEGRSAGEIVSILEDEKHKVRLLAVVDDLKYFRKGGRLSGAEAFAGTLLGIKPVVGMKNGQVGLVGKARGMPGAYVALFKLLDQEGGLDPDKRYLVGYAAHHRAVEPIQKYLIGNLHLPAAEVFHIGPVIGTHAGPGAAGIAYFVKEPDKSE